ncbi:hypothetical protein QL093DRAFT_1438741 [Fusarium oxysporum]|nr:hypothetical protein QL093DRAFT_1438741 [Fusarium oxysporum]
MMATAMMAYAAWPIRPTTPSTSRCRIRGPYKLANHGIPARSQGSDSQARGTQGAVALCRWEQPMRERRPLQSERCLPEPKEGSATTSTGQATTVATDRDGLHSVPCHPGVLSAGKSCLRFSEYSARCSAFFRVQFSSWICASVLRRFEVMGGQGTRELDVCLLYLGSAFSTWGGTLGWFMWMAVWKKTPDPMYRSVATETKPLN